LAGSHAFFDDWRWQIKNCISTVDELVNSLPNKEGLSEWARSNFKEAALPFSVTPYFASLMTGSANCPIFLQVVSTSQELLIDSTEFRDPLDEEKRQHVPHLVHRYPDRVLFLATDRCASYCRFCMRKRWVGQGPTPMRDEQEEAFRYIEARVQIKEIVFSGGDPLLLSNERVHDLVTRAYSIKHIEVVRFHSRMLSFAPMRIDHELCNIFKQYSPIYLVTHFNHPREITEQALKAVNLLIDSGVVLLNQSVLLKGINDDEMILVDLMRALVKNRIRPYYLHQCDVITGASHFRVPIARSIDLVERLRGHISGLCQPTLVVDIPGGHGKVPLRKNPIVKEDEHFIYLQGYSGGIAPYPKD